MAPYVVEWGGTALNSHKPRKKEKNRWRERLGRGGRQTVVTTGRK